MSSQPASSTQPSERSTPTCSSPSDSNSPSTSSYRDLTAERILQNLRQLEPQGIHYAGDKIDPAKYEFVYDKRLKGDILISKDEDSDLSEFVLAGIFKIDARNFFMTSDGKWNSNSSVGNFFQVKPSCLLVPVQRNSDLSSFSNDFPSIIGNIRAIEAITDPKKGHNITSIIANDSSTAMKLTHHLFVDNKNSTPTDNDDNRFTIYNWPVSSSNESYLDTIKATHNVQPLPAYDIRGKIIHPLEYEEKLAGAIARVCFTVVHYHIKEKHIFNALVQDITIVRPPTFISPPKSTLKKILHPKIHVHT